MGWWSKTVMGGDTPMDMQCHINDVLKISDEATPHQVMVAFNRGTNLDKCLFVVKQRTDYYCTDDHLAIAGQVLGVMIIESGARLPMNVRAHVLASIDADEWAQTDEQRKVIMQAFRAQIVAYPHEGGSPVEVDYEGLFDKIAKHEAAGKTGLVNERLGEK